MPAFCVKPYISVKQHVTERACKNLHMLNTPVTPASRYAKNLRVLIAMHQKTVAEVAAAAKVIPKQVYNFLNQSHDRRIKGLEKVAGVFGLTTWQMLAVDLTSNPAENKRILALLEHFSSADEAGRETIMQVAEIAASKALNRD
jgi:transcriptional regulator with XRE-family HTH domain